jgi:homoserine O-succinyltransferase/O-acetyltransferase
MPLMLMNRQRQLLSTLEELNTDVAQKPAELTGAPDTIEIGLINNMPDAALEATERQFSNLLRAAAGAMDVRLAFYSFPEVERSTNARQRIEKSYCGIEALLGKSLDAIIVTGAEPREPDISREPYWNRLVQVLEWADKNTASSVWSCLAAHAAVLKLDGIARRPLTSKLSGVFEHRAVHSHLLTRGVATRHAMPHSRWNDLAKADLERAGYGILTDSAEAGVNLFIKHAESLFLFWQGHPEYDEHSLLKEYRRDVLRFLRGERSGYPAMPDGYFDAEAAGRFDDFRERALADRDTVDIGQFPADSAAKHLGSAWQLPAVQTYTNWLQYLTAAKAERYS